MNKIVDLILQEPNVEEVLEEARRAYESEQRARAEFIEWLTPGVKAEFILGDVIVHSPAEEMHTKTLMNLVKLVGAFVDKKQLGKIRAEKALVRLGRHDFEPDLSFWSSKKTHDWTSDMMFYSTPDFVIEILSKSTENRDRGIKRTTYQDYGVAEYWIVNPMQEVVEQYENVLKRAGIHELQHRATYGISDDIPCIVLAELQLPVEAIFDEAKCFAAQSKILLE